jgi:hypothetical protein
MLESLWSLGIGRIREECIKMLKVARNLTFVALAAAMSLLAADPFLGTWKMNPAKSKYNPGPAPKSATMAYTQDGDWIVGKSDTVGADGRATTATNRYKRDGKEYPYKSATGDSGTIAVKAIDANTAQATIKAGKSTLTIRTTISNDGKSFTRTTKGTDAEGRQIDNVAVYEKQ